MSSAVNFKRHLLIFRFIYLFFWVDCPFKYKNLRSEGKEDHIYKSCDWLFIHPSSKSNVWGQKVPNTKYDLMKMMKLWFSGCRIWGRLPATFIRNEDDNLTLRLKSSELRASLNVSVGSWACPLHTADKSAYWLFTLIKEKVNFSR